MTDMVNVNDLVFHSSPDPKLFQPRVNLKSVTFDPSMGISFRVEPDNWPDYLPPGWQGPIHATLWAGFFVDNRPHVAGFMQFYRGPNPKIWTGAPILQVDTESGKLQWNKNWAYDNRWAPLNNYAPRAGNRMILFLTAGNARKGSAGFEPDITSVAERTNIVVIEVPPANVSRTFTFDTPVDNGNQDNGNGSNGGNGGGTNSDVIELAHAVRGQIEVLSELVIAMKDLKDVVSPTHDLLAHAINLIEEVKNRQDNTLEGRAGLNLVLRRTDRK